jgi:hypothetical protein
MLRRILLAIPCCLAAAGQGVAADLFRDKIAPLLETRCLSCHNAQKKRGGLDLSTRTSALAGGKNGPVLVPGAAAKSRLVQMIGGANPRMPRTGAKLSAGEVAQVRRWIGTGANWPASLALAAKGRADEETWWSLRPLVRPVVPVTKLRWGRTAIDAFILEGLEAHGLRPAPEADRPTLIRRLTFDLHGLPPTPEEVDAFVADRRPDAYERLVDRLLGSPAYGERWGRHWLDVAHYGDTHGYDKDKRRDFAWPFRDWVIRAFNSDLPYTDFVRRQIAGDVLAPGDPDGIIATGFVVAGPWDFVGHVELREGTVDKEKTRLIDRDDMVSNTLGTFVSMTVGCARCHDHKFDPIPQKDYYRLQAVFAGVQRGNRPLRTGGPMVYAIQPIPPRPIWVLHRGEVEQHRQAVSAGGLACVQGPAADFKIAGKEEGARRAALADWIADERNMLTWRSIVNRVWHYHFGRGIVDTPSDFGRNGSLPMHPELLDWLASEFVGQAFQPDGLKSQAGKPDLRGSLKRLHRLIVTSAVYRQSSRHDETAARVDADNRTLWRMNRRRLDAESLRDAVLAVSGQLDRRMGGPGYEPFRFKDDHSPIYDHDDLKKILDPATYRRTIYRFTVRSVPNPFLDCMDCPDPSLHTPVRNATLTALQALALLNNPFMVRQASHFADRLKGLSTDVEVQVEQAYRLAFGRPPSEEEKAAVAAHVRKHGLAKACRVLFSANEFVFVD